MGTKTDIWKKIKGVWDWKKDFHFKKLIQIKKIAIKKMMIKSDRLKS
jgi:hypothetical protein